MTKLESAAPCDGAVESQFYALEVMCRDRARLADKEANYWLAEAEEWARLRQSCNQRHSLAEKEPLGSYASGSKS
jgi:hypothetical protein